MVDGKVSGHALLYDKTGTLLAHCERPGIQSVLYSGYAYEGDAFMLYGGFGVIGHDLR